ncbi:hypothetical protein C8R48DRAFT_669223 [Suillus tomentosus]|nr:hypothetical protein C8R48DRAFT_669223 [Suillus tomentosus]
MLEATERPEEIRLESRYLESRTSHNQKYTFLCLLCVLLSAHPSAPEHLQTVAECHRGILIKINPPGDESDLNTRSTSGIPPHSPCLNASAMKALPSSNKKRKPDLVLSDVITARWGETSGYLDFGHTNGMFSRSSEDRLRFSLSGSNLSPQKGHYRPGRWLVFS